MDLLEKNPPPDDVVPAPPNLRQALFSVPVCFLFMFHPLFRGCWDLWAQALVTFAWAVLAIFAGLFLIRKTEREDSLHEIQIPLTLFLLVSFLSSSFSRFPHSAVPAFLADGTALAFFVFFLISTPLWRARYLRALAGGGTVAAFLALFQLHLHPHAPPTGPFVNPNLLAAYLLLTLPLTGALLLDETSRSSRLIWGGALLAQTAVLFSTASFMAFLALLAEGLCLALWPASPVSAKRRKILLALTAGAAVGGLVFFRHDWARLIHWEADRTAWWRTAFQMWLNNPLWGVGPGAFGEAYPGYRADPLGLNSLYAHNVFLEWLAERGGAGAGAALFLIFLLWIGRRRNAAENKFTVPVLTAMGGFLFFNAAHFGLSFPSLYWVFWSLAGYLWATAAPPPDRGGRTEKSRRALRTGLL
ncbi:MAG TPA: O-antigen ligase family protein, partial [Elusimicrobiota bacterium]|nr:O-antigen ligase family protein [Elusimicrobiota bacterium]